jgi:hypothetical protein
MEDGESTDDDPVLTARCGRPSSDAPSYEDSRSSCSSDSPSCRSIVGRTSGDISSSIAGEFVSDLFASEGTSDWDSEVGA